MSQELFRKSDTMPVARGTPSAVALQKHQSVPDSPKSRRVINNFQAMILEAFEAKLRWEDLVASGKLEDLRSSLMHWAAINDKAWQVVFSESKVTSYKPLQELSDKALTRKVTINLNVSTDQLVESLRRMGSGGGVPCPQLHPFGYGNSIMQKSAPLFKFEILQEIDSDTHIVHTVGCKTESSPPVWQRFSLINVSRPTEGVVVITQYPVKRPDAERKSYGRIHRDKMVLTAVIKDDISHPQRSKMELVHMRHMPGRFRAFPRTFQDKMADEDTRLFAVRILQDASSGIKKFDSSNRGSKDDADTGSETGPSNELHRVKRGKYLGLLNSYFEFIECLAAERLAEWSSLGTPPKQNRSLLTAATSFRNKAISSIEETVGKVSPRRNESYSGTDSEDGLALVGFTALSKNLGVSPFDGICDALRCQFTLRKQDPKNLARLISATGFWQEFEPIADIKVLDAAKTRFPEMQGCHELTLQTSDTGMNPWLGLIHTMNGYDSDGSIKVTLLGNIELIHCLQKGHLKHTLTDKDYPPFFCTFKFEPRGKEDSMVTCVVSLGENDNPHEMQRRFSSSFTRALANQLQQAPACPFCCSFDAIDDLELPNSFKGLFKSLLLPLRLMT